MTEEERLEFERKGLEEQKLKESMAEKKPEWRLFYDMEGDMNLIKRDHWTKVIDDQFEQIAGDEEDRW